MIERDPGPEGGVEYGDDSQQWSIVSTVMCQECDCFPHIVGELRPMAESDPMDIRLRFISQ